MTRYSMADLDAWTGKTRRRLDAIVKQATNDLMNGIEVVPGIARGGSPKRGAIPRDFGALAGSLQSTLYGSTPLSGTGRGSYTLVVGAMRGGDLATFGWGGGNAPYARPIHYGFNGYPGTFWRDVAAGKWPGYVSKAVTRAKAMIP
jgi:hypothetical protein